MPDPGLQAFNSAINLTQTNPGAGALAGPGGSSGYTFQIPPGYDQNNPVDALVLNQFQQAINAGATDAGSQPTAANMDYWRQQINQTGGAASDNLSYWQNRMTAGQAGGSSGGAGGPQLGPTMGGSSTLGAPGSNGQYGSLTSAPGLYTAPTYTPPANYTAPTFTAPTAAQAMASPGTQEGLQLGTDAIQASAAAKGSVLSGGTLKDLQQYAQNYGATQYGNVYNQALSGFNANTGAGQYANTSNLGAGQTAFNLNTGAGQYANTSNLGAGLSAFNANTGAGQFGYDANVNAQTTAQNNYWARLQSLYGGAGGTQVSPTG